MKKFEELAEHQYIKSMLAFIDMNRVKYEPKRSTFSRWEDFAAGTETETSELAYQTMVEREYKYFCNISDHYRNL
jgi:hypothetical protein